MEFANTLRGLAALCVLVSHYYRAFWVSRDAVTALTNTPELTFAQAGIPIYISWINYLPIFNWGAFGVALFFLISGFVIPFTLFKSGSLEFMLNRMIRIYPVYASGFSITLLGILIGSHYYGRAWPFPPNFIYRHIPGLRDILWSPNIDGIIWTLEIEMKFYVICAMCSALFRRRSIFIFIIPLAICITGFVVYPRLPWLLANHVEIYKQAFNFVYAAHFLYTCS